ncbi:MAG: fumarylacetoacetate hydrolase family protein [Pseudomonadota bacterium]
MSFQFHGEQCYGIATDRGVIDASVPLAADYPTLRDAIAGDGLQQMAGLSEQNAPLLSYDDVDFAPVICNPDKIICVGINYKPHREETGRDKPKFPVLFSRFASSQVGHDQALVAPSVSPHYDYEGELALIIGTPGRHITRERALDHVAGYACFNDGSVRDFQRHSAQFTAGKNFTASGSFGPWMVTADEIEDPASLTLTTRLNNTVMQTAKVADLDFDIPHLISYISSFTRLLPGDVIVTGTPGGVGYVRKPPVYMQHGDVVEVAISRIGALRNVVVDETALGGAS